MGNILPWSNSKCYRAIERTNVLRKKRLEEARQKVAAYGQDVAEREKIHTLSMIQLKDALQRGEFTAVQVLYAYAYYALEAHGRLNCISEFLLEAFEEAEALDRKFVSGKKPPLFGLPFSVKANFNLKGYDCCIGNAQLLDHPCTKDCTFVTLLRSLGAVPFCMTNVPQTLISFACSNPVYGTTGNHHNPERTPGGSSGGDATLLAARGTAFATGGDIGGSLRIPAHFCGVTTIKPAQARFEILNAHTGVPGHGRLGLGTGLFAHSVDELILLLQHTIGNKDYQKQLMPRSTPLPLDAHEIDKIEKEAQNTKLKIGYYFNDGFLKPVPACARVVERAVEQLRLEGHEMVHFPIPEPNKAASLLFKCIVSDGGTFFRKTFSENPVDPYLKKFALMLKVPFVIRWLLAFVMDWFSPQLAVILRAYVRTPSHVRETQAALDEYVNNFMEQWMAAGLDLLVVPAFPVPAVPFGACSDLSPCAFATGLFNMLDFPAGIIPAGHVTANDDKALKDEAQWATGKNLLLKQMRAAAANSSGLPLGVQIVGLPWSEEKCLALMRILERRLNWESLDKDNVGGQKPAAVTK